MFSETKKIANSATSSLPFEGQEEEESYEGKSVIANSSDIAIRVKSLSKCYQIYDKPHDRLKQSLSLRLHRLVGPSPNQYNREFSALEGVSFDVTHDVTIVILGPQGSGRATLIPRLGGTPLHTPGLLQSPRQLPHCDSGSVV